MSSPQNSQRTGVLFQAILLTPDLLNPNGFKETQIQLPYPVIQTTNARAQRKCKMYGLFLWVPYRFRRFHAKASLQCLLIRKFDGILYNNSNASWFHKFKKPQETYRKNVQHHGNSPHLGTSVASARANLASSSRTVASQSRKTSSWSARWGHGGWGFPWIPGVKKGPIFGKCWSPGRNSDFWKKKWKEMEDFCDPNGKIILNQWISVDVPAMLGDSRLGMNHPGWCGNAHPLQALHIGEVGNPWCWNLRTSELECLVIFDVQPAILGAELCSMLVKLGIILRLQSLVHPVDETYPVKRGKHTLRHSSHGSRKHAWPDHPPT